MKTYDPRALKIYVDGSAIPNPGVGGLGIVVEYPDELELKNTEISEGYFETTNNRMELLACIRAFQWLRNNERKVEITRAIIITDSEYVYNNKNNASYWKKNGWKTKEGRPYENEDLWDNFLKEMVKTGIRTDIEVEEGKTREILNRVDALAKNGAKNPTREDFGYKKGKITATRTSNKKGATLFPANNQIEIIRFYRYNIKGKLEDKVYKITFDLYSKKENKFIEKYFAYISKTYDWHRNHCYLVKFNDNPHFPKIERIKSIKYPKVKKSYPRPQKKHVRFGKLSISSS